MSIECVRNRFLLRADKNTKSDCDSGDMIDPLPCAGMLLSPVPSSQSNPPSSSPSSHFLKCQRDLTE